jgi:hypothetical protein
MSTPTTYKTGIYFLLNKGVVVYIGQTTRYPKRLYYHYSQALPHDCIRFMSCDQSKLNDYERRWIRLFKPEYNKTHNVGLKVKKSRIKAQQIKRRMQFRVLTKKSFKGFGFLKDSTIEQLLSHGKVIEVVSMYFNYSHISFREDVLEELKITKEWRIQKPGVNKEMFFQFCEATYPIQYANSREFYVKRIRANQRLKLKRDFAGTYSKAYNKSVNQRG